MISSALQIGLVDFFDPTLLVLGDSDSFLWLAGEISSRHLVALERPGAQERAKLQFVPDALGGTLARDGAEFLWEISEAEAKHVSGQLKALALSGGPGHQYLDPERNDTGIQIIASLGEYDARVFARPD